MNDRKKRIWIVGPPGSGKTTLSKKLSQELDLKVYHLDEYYWEENWKLKDNVIQNELRHLLNEDMNWIVEGFYTDSSSLLFEEATKIYLLKINYFKMYYRIIKRSFWRILTNQKVCGENRENIRFLFSVNGLILHAHKQYFEFRELEKGNKCVDVISNNEKEQINRMVEDLTAKAHREKI